MAPLCLAPDFIHQVQTYHRILNRVSWSGPRASQILLGLLLTTFVAAGMPVVLAADETLERRTGPKIPGLGCFRDPVRSYQAWLQASGITSGPIFRPINRHGQVRPTRLFDKAVALIVKRTATAAGLDATQFAGHSLRAGLATAATTAGVSERAIMNQTGHKSVTVARRYIREGSLFRENAAAAVGL